MTNYKYWILRYVPNTRTDEFVNIGVIVGAGEDWSLKTLSRWNHASRLGGDLRLVRPWIERISERVAASTADQHTLDGFEKLIDAHYLDGIARIHNNILRVHPGGPAAVDCADTGAELLFNILIDEEPPATRLHRRAAVRKYLDDQLSQWVTEHPRLRMAKSPELQVGQTTEAFDFVIRSATYSEHLAHAWAFDQKDTKTLSRNIRSWFWSVGLMRENGGSLHLPNRKTSRQISADVPISVVYAPPKTDDQKRVFDMSLESFSSLGIESYTEDKTDDLLSNLVTAA